MEEWPVLVEGECKMTEETIKRSSFDELSERYDRVYKDNKEFSDMFDFDVIAPYSDARTPTPPSPWRKGNIVRIK